MVMVMVSMLKSNQMLEVESEYILLFHLFQSPVHKLLKYLMEYSFHFHRSCILFSKQ